MNDIERLYGWEAETEDGRVFTSAQMGTQYRGGYDAIASEHRGKIRRFSVTMLVHRRDPGNPLAVGESKLFRVITHHLKPSERVVYRRRVALATGGGSRACILAGVRGTVRGRDVQRIAWIFEDTGEIHMTSDFDESHQDFYPPTLREYEVPT